MTGVGRHEEAQGVLQEATRRMREADAAGDSTSNYYRGRLHESMVSSMVWEGLDAWAECGCGRVYLRDDEAETVRERLQWSESLYQNTRGERRTPMLAVHRSGVDLLRGRLDRARATARRAVSTAREQGYVWGAVAGQLMQARVDLAAGQLEAARGAVQEVRAVLDTVSVDDAAAIRAQYGAEADRVAAQIHDRRGDYGRLLAALWQLRLRDAPGADRHFQVAEAATVPLTRTTGWIGFGALAFIFVVQFVSRRMTESAADRIERLLAPSSDRDRAYYGGLSSGFVHGSRGDGAGGRGGGDGSDDEYDDDEDDDELPDFELGDFSTGSPSGFRTYPEMLERMAPGLLDGDEGLYDIRMIDATMIPAIRPGDLLRVQQTTSFEGKGIYLYEMENTWHIKRLEPAEGGLRVVPHNDSYEAYILPEGGDWEIRARVVGIV